MQRYAGKPIILITTTKSHSRTQHKNTVNVEVQRNCITKWFARSYERIGLASAPHDAPNNAIHSQTQKIHIDLMVLFRIWAEILSIMKMDETTAPRPYPN